MEYQLAYLYCDLNSYFATVEQQENPALRGKPVAVIPVETDATCAIAASVEAKKFGIKTGTKIYEAKRMCPDLVCVLARPNIYVDYHHRILEAVDTVLPVNKVWSIDEFDCVLMGREREPENALRLGREIKQAIWSKVGEAVNCSVGLAPNSFLAKVATDMQKPNGLVMLPKNQLPGGLFDLKLTDLPGINTRMQLRLWRASVYSVEDLWNLSPKQARAIWGSVHGEKFWLWLHGESAPYTETKPSMIGHSRVLDPNLRTPEMTRQMGRRLLFKATVRMRNKGFHATNFAMSVRRVDGVRWEGHVQLSAARDPFTFLEHFQALWAQMMREMFGADHARIANRIVFKKISVVLSGLRAEGQVMSDLFDVPDERQQHVSRKREALAAGLDKLREKYKGSEPVTLGLPPKTLSGHVGTKIAFSRVPDKSEFW